MRVTARAAGHTGAGAGAGVLRVRRRGVRGHGRSVHVRWSGDDRYWRAVRVVGGVGHDVVSVEWLVRWRHGRVWADRELDEPGRDVRGRLVAVPDGADRRACLQLLDRRRELRDAGRGAVLSGDRHRSDGPNASRQRCVPPIDQSGWRRVGVADSAVRAFPAARCARAGVCRGRVHDGMHRRERVAFMGVGRRCEP